MRSPVTHLLRRCLILLAILVLADRLIGAGLEYMFYKQHHGDDAVTRYTLDSTHEQLLVLGSSRASHHYITRELEQQLDLSVYNCGRDEMGISYTAAVLPLIYKRYNPQVIIVEVLPTELSNWGMESGLQHISTVLIPFANKYPDLWPTISLAGRTEVYKAAVSKIYPYNSMIGAFVQNTYTHLGHKTYRGYEPLRNSIDSARYTKSYWKNYKEAVKVEPLLLDRFTSILHIAAQHNTRVFVMISPFYFYQDARDNISYQALKAVTEQRGAGFMDWSLDPRFIRHPALFNDDLHLNDSGAHVYTRIIADTLRSIGIYRPVLNN